MAADKDGRLQPEDKIVGIQKDKGEEIDFVEKKLSDVVRYIRGPAGTTVRLIVQPAGTKERKIYELTRQRIELREQHAKGKIIETKQNGKQLKLGVIHLPAFYGDTMALLAGRSQRRERHGRLPQDSGRFQGRGRRCRGHGPARQRRRLARGSKDPLGFVHRHRPGGAGERDLRGQAPVRRR